jgi:hypothetical protein
MYGDICFSHSSTSSLLAMEGTFESSRCWRPLPLMTRLPRRQTLTPCPTMKRMLPLLMGLLWTILIATKKHRLHRPTTWRFLRPLTWNPLLLHLTRSSKSHLHLEDTFDRRPLRLMNPRLHRLTMKMSLLRRPTKKKALLRRPTKKALLHRLTIEPSIYICTTQHYGTICFHTFLTDY